MVRAWSGDRRDPAVDRRVGADNEARLRVDPRRAHQSVSAGDRRRRRHGAHRAARPCRRRRQQTLAATRRTYTRPSSLYLPSTYNTTRSSADAVIARHASRRVPPEVQDSTFFQTPAHRML